MSKRFLYRIAPPLFVLLGVAFLLSVASLVPKHFSNAPSFAQAAGSNLGCVSGWAWSDNIGWIDFECSNVIVQSDGTITGYAWANPSDDVDGTNNIGWISFNAADTASCGSAARVTGTSITGWAKALSADNLGWDGCISLSGSSPAYGVTLPGGTNASGSLDGYAWGSDVVGWISFNCDTGGSSQASVCGTSNYAVTFTTTYVPPPYIASAGFTVSPTRVQKNKPENVTFSWLVGGTVPPTCTISGPGVSLTVSPVSGVPGSAPPVSVTLSQDSVYTLTCGVATANATVELIPVVKEL